MHAGTFQSPFSFEDFSLPKLAQEKVHTHDASLSAAVTDAEKDSDIIRFHPNASESLEAIPEVVYNGSLPLIDFTPELDFFGDLDEISPGPWTFALDLFASSDRELGRYIIDSDQDVNSDESHDSSDEAAPSPEWLPFTVAFRSDGLVDIDRLISSLLLLGYGLSSQLFVVSSDRHSFTIHRDGPFRCNDIGHHDLVKLIASFQETGEQALRIRLFAEQVTSSASTESAAKTALATTMNSMLEILYARSCGDLAQKRTVHALRKSFEGVTDLFSILGQIINAVSAGTDDCTIMEHLTAVLSRNDDLILAYPHFCQIMSSRAGRSITESILNACGLLRSEVPYTDRSDHELSDLAAALSLHDAPSASPDVLCERLRKVAPAADLDMLLDVLRAREILARSDDAIGAFSPVLATDDLGSGKVFVNPDAILARAQQYEAEVMAAIRASSTTSGDQLEQSCGQYDNVLNSDVRTSSAGSQFAHLAIAMTTVPDTTPDKDRELEQALITDLGNDTNDLSSRGQAPSEFCILSPYQPFIRVQHRLVNGQVLRRLLGPGQLMEHFDAHHQFHLLGNGVFVARLQMTLFEPKGSLPSARAFIEGKFTSGSDGTKQHWPPGSSDLWNALAELFSETYNSTMSTAQHDSPTVRGIPGNLNIAVRHVDTPRTAEIMNPLSTHALDFLQLRYNSPALLSDVFDAASSEQYDDIFRWLLVLLRQSYVSTRLSSLLLSRQADLRGLPGRVARRFAYLGQAIVAPLCAHAFSVAVATPWSDFMSAMETLQDDLEDENEEGVYGAIVNTGISGLKTLHNEALRRIKSRLFLDVNQEHIETAVRTLFTLLLRGSACILRLSQSATDAQAYNDTQEEVSEVLRLEHEVRESVKELRRALQTHSINFKEADDVAVDGDLWAKFGMLPPENDEAEIIGNLVAFLSLDPTTGKAKETWDSP
ncbi:hypothetical protein BDZ85DRAFT_281842 [Elsinoe ampelina]|uniref:Spindle pole body component n=1 Tax=Elsinoe ampelina TaxID=302913 RepID=A0A6A6GBP2_9PEZI|nr:hypothetical protein BDZ85DRAFT_281842 [Elsinoe ampelina]